MRFLIITHVIHKKEGDLYYGYGPYVREMNVWMKHVDEVQVIGPLNYVSPGPIDVAYHHPRLKFLPVRQLDFTSASNMLRSLIFLPSICFKMLKAMRRADHIHLRCPGNMGLIGCFLQIFFPSKVKTAKYAGNWDFKSTQPFTYRLQQKILRNTMLTKKMTALVYGDWPGGTKNIKPFFTASYHVHDKDPLTPRKPEGLIRLVFAGTLTRSKQPLLSAQICHTLLSQGYDTELHIYGEGPERMALSDFIIDNHLEKYIFLHGNQSCHVIKEAFSRSHFLVFLSRSEGWPKVVAEAMWWGCLPVTTSVSCTPEMLGYGERGELVANSVEDVCKVIISNIHSPAAYAEKCMKAMTWARNYTVEMFESEIKKMIV